jgi:hypothetical protein
MGGFEWDCAGGWENARMGTGRRARDNGFRSDEEDAWLVWRMSSWNTAVLLFPQNLSCTVQYHTAPVLVLLEYFERLKWRGARPVMFITWFPQAPHFFYPLNHVLRFPLLYRIAPTSARYRCGCCFYSQRTPPVSRHEGTSLFLASRLLCSQDACAKL